jgi:drug/metabolite transporter (DMT)-like permease
VVDSVPGMRPSTGPAAPSYAAPAPHLPVVPAAAFVLVWSSGYIAGPAAVDAVAPFTVLGWRFLLAAGLGVALALVLRRPARMARDTLVRVALVGLVMNAVQFGFVYVAFELGLSATVASLFHSLSPVLTALLAAGLLHERLSWVQVGGFLLGVAGVLLVLGSDLEGTGGLVAVLLGATSMLTLSLGTLGQRWIGGHPDLLWSASVQFAVSAPPLLVTGWLVEGAWPVTDPAQAIVSLLYLAVVNSIVGLVLLALLVLRGGSGAAASLFFLSPPVTAVMAWLVLGETLGPRQVVGLLVAVVGVGAATHPRSRLRRSAPT